MALSYNSRVDYKRTPSQLTYDTEADIFVEIEELSWRKGNSLARHLTHLTIENIILNVAWSNEK